MILNKFNQEYSLNRDQTFDLLKGFAVLMMIQVHLMELFAEPRISQSIVGKVSLFLGGPPAAPVFMVVMGYFLAQSKKRLSQSLSRGFILIFGGILLNIGLNLHLLILISLNKVQLDPLKYIFGADILPLAGFSIILISFIKKVAKNNFYTSSILVFFFLIFILILHSITQDHIATSKSLIYLQAFFYGKLDWSYFPLLLWASYPLIGFLYGLIYQHFKPDDGVKKLLVLVTFVITFVTFRYGIDIASDLKTYYHHDWLYVLWNIQFIIFLGYGFDTIEKFYKKTSFLTYFKWLGRNVTVVYVFQWLIIGNIATLVYKTQGAAELLGWFLVVLALTTLATYGYEKYRIVKTPLK